MRLGLSKGAVTLKARGITGATLFPRLRKTDAKGGNGGAQAEHG